MHNAIGLHELFDKYEPNDNGFEIKPSQVLCMMVMNIVVAPKPLYKVEDWLIEYLDGKAEDVEKAGKYNDDRMGRCLQSLFCSDRHSLMSEASVAAIKVHDLETKRIHNDSTTVSFSGAYHHQSPDAVQLKLGHNKDNRPDYKQIVFGLNITEDGHVPISYQAFNGNQADVNTHIPNWDGLREFLANENFFYIADSKLCSENNMHHIERNNGKFITIMPKNRNEVSQFHEQLRQGEKIEWQPAYSTEHSRKKGQLIIYQTYAEDKSREGYYIVWVHSSSKKKIGPGRPGPNTRYEDKEQIIYHIWWYRDEEVIEQASKTDGIFPLITNTTLPAAEVLQICKKQPFLEKRFYTKKSVLEVAPMFLKNNQRIEAMLFLYFIALRLVSLIERNIRRQMVEEEIKSLPILLPARMKIKAPTWNNIHFFFRNIH